MKKNLLLAAICLMSTLSLSAQKIRLASWDMKDHNLYKRQHWIDRDAKMFYFDSDSESDSNFKITNYKKIGIKETFTATNVEMGSPIVDVTLLIDENNPENNFLKLKFKDGTYVEGTYITVGDDGPSKANGKTSKSTKDSSESVKDKVNSKAKSLVNKSKGPFKKK